MYYEAVKAAFNRFPVDPPGSLSPGDYVRIGWGGKLLHLGNLGSLLKAKINVDSDACELEYLSNGVRKEQLGVQTGLSAGNIEGKIYFSNKPGLYIRGKRTVYRLRNLNALLSQLASSDMVWRIWHRIVVETHYVEDADIICSSDSSADVKVKYDETGVPIFVDGEYARQQRSLLYLDHVSGAFAFGAIYFSKWFGVLGASNIPSFQSGPLDVNDPEVFEDSFEEE